MDNSTETIETKVLTFWRTANYDDGGENGSPSLTCDYEGQEYVVSPATVRKALHLPEEKKYDASDKLKIALPDKYEALFSDENIPQPPSPAHEPIVKSDPKPTSGSSQQGPVEKSSPKRILRSTKCPIKPSPPPRKRRFLQKISDSESDEDIPPPPPAKKLRKKIKPTSITDLTVEPPQSEDPEQALIPFSDQSAEPLLIEPLSAMPLDIAAADKQMLESTSDHNDQTEGNKSVEEKIAADTDISEKPSDAPSKSEDAQIEMVLHLIQDSLVQPEDIVAAPAQEIPMAENSEAATEALESHTLSVFLADIDDDEGTEVTSTPIQAPGIHSIISEPVRETTPERVDSPVKAMSPVRESTPFIAPAVPSSPLPSSEPARRRICHLSYNHRMCRTTSPSVEDRLTSIEATQASMHYTLTDLSASVAQLVQILTSADVKKGEKTSKDKCKPDQQIKRKKPDDDEEEKGEMSKHKAVRDSDAVSKEINLVSSEVEKKKEKLVAEAEKLIEAGDPESQKFCQTLKFRGKETTLFYKSPSLQAIDEAMARKIFEKENPGKQKIPKQKGIVISEVNYTDINRPRTRSQTQTLSESDSKDKGKKPVDVVLPVPTMPKKSIITLAPENPTERMIKLSKNIHIIANVSDQAEEKEAELVRRRKSEFKSISEKILTSDIAQVKVPVTEERIEDTKVSWLKLNTEKTQDDLKKKSLYGSLGVEFVPNNHAAILNTADAPRDYHPIQQFLAQSALDGSPSIVFSYEGEEYAVTPATVRQAFNMPESAAYMTNGDTNLRSMMDALGYSESLEKLGQLKRPGLKREWSFFFDCITRAFQKKSTNWDAIPMDMLQIGLHKRVFNDLISKDEKYPIQRPLLIPAPVRARMDLPQQQQPQQQQPQPPISPTATKQPRSSASKSKKATKSDENPSTKKTRTSVVTQVLQTKSDKLANSDAANSDAVNTEAASPPKQKRRRLVAAYDYDDLEASPATNSEPSQASPQTKTARFKRRANKPKRAKVPITEITDFTIEEEQAPFTTIPDDLSQALMVHPLQAVPLSTATASSTSSENRGSQFQRNSKYG
ncbi:uncharacterized protein LOC135150333 [Daucus carota subsp. sativus]|uniref:uncharacterized protein LOC135150333 n=1 Tax=Daucus carota subsp. sativus TaxID=79200 RepID=UPI003083D069